MKKLLLLPCLLCLVLGIGCKPDPVTESDLVETSVVSCQTASGAYVIDCTFSTYPPPKNEHCSMHLVIRRADEESLSQSLEIQIDADMPAHGHGINTQPEIERIGEGEYEVRGLLFHMGGLWELYIDCVEDGIPDRGTIAFTL